MGIRQWSIRPILAALLVVGTLGIQLTSNAHTASAAGLTWIVSNAAVNFISDLDPSLAKQTFGASNTLLSGAVPAGWSSTPFKNYASYAAFSSDVSSGAITPSQFPVVMYDIEDWSATPSNEAADPPTYMKLFSQLGHANGFSTIMAPAIDLTNVYGNCDPSNLSGWQCYIQDGLAGAAAQYSDRYHIQAQSQEFTSNYQTFVQQAHDQAIAANATVAITAGLSTNPPAGTPTAAILFNDVQAVQSYVSGYWLNIPDSSLGFCPSCGPSRPDVAIQFLELLSGQTLYYAHSGGTMDGTSPTSTTTYSSFPLTTNGASITWTSSASYTAGSKIPAGTYTWQYYTDSTNANSAKVALVFGYCSSGCPSASQVPIVNAWSATLVGGSSGGANGGPTTLATTTSATTLPSGGPWTLYLTVTVSAAAPSSMNLLYDSGPAGANDQSVNYPTNLATPALSQPIDFALSLSPGSQTVAPGASTTYTVTVMPSGGFTGSVNLSVSGLPSGASGSFSPNPATSSSTLTVSTSSTTPTGTSTLAVTGTSGSLSHSAQATLIVSSTSAPPPKLVQSGAVVRGSLSTAITLTLPAGSSKGDLLVATLTTAVSGSSGFSFTAPSGWIKAVALSSGDQDSEIWYYPNNPGGISSATFTPNNGYPRGQMTEWSGANSSAPLDVTGSGAVSSAASATVATSSATSGSADVGVTSWAFDPGSATTVTFTPGSGWTNLGNTGSLAIRYNATSDDESGVSGTVSETEAASVSGAWVAVMATFKP